MKLVSRFKGCLVGVGVGDALGAPIEGMSKGEIRQKYGQVTRMLAGGWHVLGAGDYTDDTAMTLCIARSIVEKGTFDPQDAAMRFLEWFDFGPIGIGRTTAIALAEMKRGTSWDKAGESAHHRLGGMSAGNGSIMRCAPIGLLRFRDRDRLVRDSIDSSRITHWDPRACWGAVAVNLCIAEILEGRESGLLLNVAPMVEEPEVRGVIERAAGSDVFDREPTAYVLDTLEAASWCFANTATFEEALIAAVNLGGDTDTVGAVCGALAGAKYGLEAIPQKWEGLLQSREEIVELAEKILYLATGEQGRG
jgi:ADP-ribosyl-[dinitrogen reductase] hydrolase